MLSRTSGPNALALAALLAAALVGMTSPRIAAAQEESARGVPYLTLRATTGDAAPRSFYGDQRGEMRAGWCGIRETVLPIPPSVVEAVPFHVPDEILRVGELREDSVDAVLDRLAVTADGAAPVLYTHGFYIDFDKGCRRATVLQENAGLAGRFLWFSWPSDGGLFNYTQDEADLYWSVPDLADVIGEMAARFGGGRVNLAGHSLGARGVVLALYDVAGRLPDVRLGDVVLLAPDIDFDTFRKLLPRIRPLVRSLTVYIAEADRPLALSAQVHGYPRLGEVGNDVARLEGVEVIDLSAIPVRSPTGHLYHVYNREVWDDLDQLFNEGRRAGERRNLVPAGANLWTLQPGD
jgi:esterase/lipase superfamily enzyme